ncbi:flippase [archaeon]|jgi:O-antigen/teichoic acid export membrane protein|nr:flippase [archaeon]MBT4417773.1 flippase [archaeon]
MQKEKTEQKKLNNSLRIVAKSSFIVLIGLIFSKIMTYVYRIIIARELGPEVYGLFSLALMISTLFIALASLGLPEGLLRYISFYRGEKEKGKSQYIFRFSLFISIITSIIIGLVLFLFAEPVSTNIFNNSNLTIFLKWFGIFIPLVTITNLFSLLTRAYEEIGWNSFIINIFQPFIKVTLLGILFFSGFKSMSIILSYNLSFIGVLILSLIVCSYKTADIFKIPNLDKKTKSKITKDLLAYSWPMMFLGMIMFIFYGIDSFIIGAFTGSEGVYNVGIYNSAVPIASLIGIAPILFIQLFFPLITKEFAKKDTKLIKDLSKQIGKWIFILNLPLTLLMILFPEFLINLLFGPEYIPAKFALIYLAIGMFFFSVFNVSEKLLSMAGKSKAVLFNLILAAIINLILNLILVPAYGINGAAFATMATYIFWSIISVLQAKYYVSIIPVRRKMLTILLISIPSFLLVYYVKQLVQPSLINTALQGILFLLLYSFLILITGALDRNDIMILHSLKNKNLKSILKKTHKQKK